MSPTKLRTVQSIVEIDPLMVVDESGSEKERHYSVFSAYTHQHKQMHGLRKRERELKYHAACGPQRSPDPWQSSGRCRCTSPGPSLPSRGCSAEARISACFWISSSKSPWAASPPSSSEWPSPPALLRLASEWLSVCQVHLHGGGRRSLRRLKKKGAWAAEC